MPASFVYAVTFRAGLCAFSEKIFYMDSEIYVAVFDRNSSRGWYSIERFL